MMMKNTTFREENLWVDVVVALFLDDQAPVAVVHLIEERFCIHAPRHGVLRMNYILSIWNIKFRKMSILIPAF